MPDYRSDAPSVNLFTADEELGCFGAKKLVEAGKGAARYAIVGEPTSLRPIRANKGYCLAEVEVLGKEGHSAYPESGASAIFRSASAAGDSGSPSTSGTPASPPSRSRTSIGTCPSSGTSAPLSLLSAAATVAPPPEPNSSVCSPQCGQTR